MHMFKFIPLMLLLVIAPTVAHAEPGPRRQAVETYARIVHANYADALADARAMGEAIDGFLADPTDQTLAAAKAAWLAARESYGQTEVFRFYGGPIDGIGDTIGLPAGAEGPEGRINAWPLNEAFIDGVKGAPESGIVHDPSIDINRDALIERNAVTDEADVTTGYHAIEFLLWGQDHRADGPGQRPVTDYTTAPGRDRRAQYLRVVTGLLIEDLAWLVESWAPDRPDNYRARFLAQDPDAALGRIMTGMATLAGFELASERLAVPLDSGDQEDEHSCFADNTHRDYVTNVIGIQNVYVGRYDQIEGVGIHDLLAAQDAELAEKLKANIDAAVAQAKALDPPIDAILATEPGSAARQPLETMVDHLYTQAELLVAAGEALGVDAQIAGE